MIELRSLGGCLLGCLVGFVGLSLPVGAQTFASGQWAWMSGSSTVPGTLGAQAGVYGTLGTPAPGNTPGGRNYAQGWTDENGNLWLFGGLLFTAQENYFNDLWKFDTASGQWAWMSGSSTVGSNCLVISGVSNCGRSGMYGTLGTPALGNTPGARYHAETWVDTSGNLWLYGGNGFDANGNSGALNDLWKFSPSTGQWAWMGGSSTVPVNAGCTSCTLGQPPVPGMLGIPAAGNTPGGLWLASTWVDKNGDFWLFGGWGYAPSGFAAVANELWQFNPSSNQWAWMGGDSTFGVNGRVYGTYGVLGKPDAGNIPGSRWSESTWTDANGNLWLFGGQGADASSPYEVILNDLWKFDPSTNQWAWMGGSSTMNCANLPQSYYCHQPGIYGTEGVPGAANIPGSRMLSFSWKDLNGNLWLFGGDGFDANSNWNSLNDLWEFNPSSDEWTWMGGNSVVGTATTGAGVYGTLGIPASVNQPGSRSGGVSWTDKRGNFWLWGGEGLDATHAVGYLNDLWVYQPSSTSPGFTVSGTAVSVTAGATTGNTSTITVTPTGGFTGSVALTAAVITSPSGALAPPTLSFNSTSPLSITGNAAGTAALTVTTTAGSSPCNSSNLMPGTIPWGAGSAVAVTCFFVFPKRRRIRPSLLSLVLLFVALVGGVVGCSGGGILSPCPDVVTSRTTAGTYMVTVTATSAAVTKTATVTVTVQ